MGECGYLIAEARLSQAPEQSAAPVAALERGERVSVLEPVAGWLRLQCDRGEGFVPASAVARVNSGGGTQFLAADTGLQGAGVEAPPDERLEPPPSAGARERAVTRAWNLYGGLLRTLSERVGIDPGCAVAVVCVESSGQGFGPDGRMIIRFENHVFRRQLPPAQQSAFARHFTIGGGQPWLGHRFREKPGDPWIAFHGSQALEWKVFEFASTLDENAAIRSISMGLPQIMGFNHELIGFATPQAMFAFLGADVRYQLLGLFDFVRGPRADGPGLAALRRGDFDAFAATYNGPGQAQFYGELIANHVDAFRRVREMARPAQPASASNASTSTGERRYDVRSGDTLGAIAGRFGVTVEAIARANGMANPDHIRIGQSLRIPASEPPPKPVAVPSLPPEEVDEDGNPRGERIHVVQAGDTLSEIASRFGTSISALAQANRITNWDRIHVGQVLVIP